MEFIIAIVLITSVVTNFVTLRFVKKLQLPSDVELVPAVLETSGCNCGIGLSEEIKQLLLPVIEDKNLDVPSSQSQSKTQLVQNESYNAWTNRVEEPTMAPNSPHKPPPIPAPLARPTGFPL